MDDLESQEAQIVLTQVVTILTKLTDTPSRWTGSVELTESLFTSGIAHLDGRT